MIYLDISQGFISNQKKTVDVTLLSFIYLNILLILIPLHYIKFLKLSQDKVWGKKQRFY